MCISKELIANYKINETLVQQPVGGLGLLDGISSDDVWSAYRVPSP